MREKTKIVSGRPGNVYKLINWVSIHNCPKRYQSRKIDLIFPC